MAGQMQGREGGRGVGCGGWTGELEMSRHVNGRTGKERRPWEQQEECRRDRTGNFLELGEWGGCSVICSGHTTEKGCGGLRGTAGTGR